MEARIHILSLGVSDLERARRFYGEGLGWPQHAKSNASIAFFRLGGGLILALYPEEALAEDAGMKPHSRSLDAAPSGEAPAPEVPSPSGEAPAPEVPSFSGQAPSSAAPPAPADRMFRGAAMAHNVASEEAVRQTIRQAVSAGGQVLVPPESVFWGGYRGYFADPDGHAWEVAYNPKWDFDADGALA
jgi:catechol 2,3-dioxygenase-like lactoylglutathione lyase family enzyme